MNNRRRARGAARTKSVSAWTAVAAVVAITSLVASCTALPTNSEPHVVRSFESPTQSNPVIAPVPNSEPDLLLRDFFAASAIPASNYEAARSFLTDAARNAWDPTVSTIVVDRISVNTLTDGGDKQSFNVQGNVIGELQSGGSFQPARQGYEATIEVERINGQWRISSLPLGVVIERTELRNRYQPYNLYFYDRDGEGLVSDRRWVFSQRDSLPSALITLLLRGPSDRLSSTLDFDIPADTAFTGFENGAYNFTGLSTLEEQDRVRFASQLVWTFSGAGINAPISVTADGGPLIPGLEKFSRDDFSDSSPLTDSMGEPNVYSLADGRLFSLTDNAAQPLDESVADQGSIASADVSGGDQYASVVGTTGEQRLMVGAFNQGAREVVRGKNFTRPSFEGNGNAVWVAADGTRVLRTVRTATGEYVTSEVDVELPEGVDGNISVLRLSRSGVRAVLIIEGSLYTGIVEGVGSGERRLVNVLEYAPDLAGSVIAADWQPDGSIIVGTSNPSSPVMRVEQDGSGTTGKSIGNITAPVVAVAASSSTIYATDANAVLHMPSGSAEALNWREVPGLQGVRSMPIVAK